MEPWQLDLEKARKNLKSIDILSNFDDPNTVNWSTVSFLAQQSVELSIKACGYWIGVDKNYPKHNKYLYNKSKRELPRNFKHTHLPSYFILFYFRDFLEKFMVDSLKFDSNFKQTLKNNLAICSKLIDVLHSAENNEKFRLDLWKYSIGIKYDNRKLQNLVCMIKKHANYEINSNLYFLLMNMRQHFKTMVEKNLNKKKLTTAQRNKFEKKIMCRLKKKMNNIFKDVNDSNQILRTIFSQDDELFKANFKQLSSNINSQTLDQLLGPNGVLYSLNVPTSSSEFKSFIKKCRNYFWSVYIISLSSVMITSFPHVFFGRYPKMVRKIPNKRIEKSTEKLYLQNYKKIQTLVNNTHDIYDRISRMLEKNKS